MIAALWTHRSCDARLAKFEIRARTCHEVSNSRFFGSCFIFSVPDVKYVLAVHLRFEIGTRNLIDRPLRVVLPRLYRRKLGSHPEHHWEIGRSGFPLSRILRDLSTIPDVRRIEHNRSVSTNSIRFFVLKR